MTAFATPPNGIARWVDRILSAPVVILLLVPTMWLRFGWIAGWHDFGWTYEPAARICAGEVQYRDFHTALPPLTHYSLAALMGMFDNSLHWFQAHLYAWWAASLLAAWALAAQVLPDRRLVAAVVLAVGLSHLPHQLQHSYNFAGQALAAAAAALVLRWRASAPAAAAAGLLIGLAFFGKPVVGAAAGAALTAILLPAGGRSWQPFWAFGAGVAAVLAGVTAGFAEAVGWTEAVEQIFWEPGQAKGGTLVVLARSFPRFRFEWDFGFRAAAETGLTLVVGTLVTVYGLYGCASASPGTRRLLAAAVAGFAGIAVTSLRPNETVAAALDALPQMLASRFLHQLLYVSAFFLAAATALRSVRGEGRNLLGPGILAVTAVVGHCASSINYPPTTGALLFPAGAWLLVRLGRGGDAAFWLGLYCLAAVTADLFLDSYQHHGFRPVAPLADTGPLAGLYGSAPDAEVSRARQDAIVPAVRGRRTVWMTNAGPHSAFGGLPAPNIACIYHDAYVARRELLLRDRWEQDPPERVVLGPCTASPQSEFFRSDVFADWLAARYAPVVSAGGLTVHVRRSTLNAAFVIGPTD